ncbi:hypothetical protein DIC66_19385 [Rhodoferax lacus]|uniref:Uncharacterized protein n=1 Tax=Rhodoferax lacus TaxID=2184758 RepID=A0A3E1R7J0_9BURK|nr:hypothetical protein [Rhodoferax lacus]RFO95277.1 hypothetical protein DIC66_19385 [Rhodoferax lacus]
MKLEPFEIFNIGNDIDCVRTQYWKSNWAANNVWHLSFLNDNARLLLPKSAERHIREMMDSKEISITRGYSNILSSPGVEILFDFELMSPFFIQLREIQCLGLPKNFTSKQPMNLFIWTKRGNVANFYAMYSQVEELPSSNRISY